MLQLLILKLWASWHMLVPSFLQPPFRDGKTAITSIFRLLQGKGRKKKKRKEKARSFSLSSYAYVAVPQASQQLSPHPSSLPSFVRTGSRHQCHPLRGQHPSWGHTADTCTSSSTPGPPSPPLQSCSPVSHSQPLTAQTQDFTFVFAEFHKVPVTRFLQLIKVPLDESSALQHISYSPPPIPHFPLPANGHSLSHIPGHWQITALTSILGG